MQEKGSIFIISGPSGAGKNAVYDGLTSKNGDIAQTISVTTRAPRCGEVNGVDYYFVSREEFLRRVKLNEFIEYVNYGENYYGTLKSEVDRLLGENKKIILVIDVRGAFNIKNVYPDATTIFIVPPSVEELRRRIVCRGENNSAEVELRLKIALEELKQCDKYDYCVVNDKLEDCIKEINNIIYN